MAEQSAPGAANGSGDGIDGARPASDISTTPTLGEPAKLVDVNKASAAELRQLGGMGRALAGRIVQYRTDNGPFAVAADLRRVPGLSPATYASIAEQVSASAPSGAAQTTPRLIRRLPPAPLPKHRSNFALYPMPVDCAELRQITVHPADDYSTDQQK